MGSGDIDVLVGAGSMTSQCAVSKDCSLGASILACFHTLCYHQNVCQCSNAECYGSKFKDTVENTINLGIFRKDTGSFGRFVGRTG